MNNHITNNNKFIHNWLQSWKELLIYFNVNQKSLINRNRHILKKLRFYQEELGIQKQNKEI